MLLLNLTLILVLVYLVINIIRVIIHNHNAHKHFKSRSPQLPVVPNPSIWLGNIKQVIWIMKSFDVVHKWHNKLGKTYGFYVGSQPWAATKDIDLIRKIELDEAHKHMDRMSFSIPVDEFNNSILQINGNDWRKVRRALAPNLTNMKVRSDVVSEDIERQIKLFVEAVDRKLDNAELTTNKRSDILDAHNHAQRITLAIIFSAVYKKENIIDFDAAEDSWVNDFERVKMVVHSSFILLMHGLPFLRPIAAWLIKFHLLGQMNARIIKFIREAVDLHFRARERRAKLQQKPDSRTGANEVAVDEVNNQPEDRRRLLDGFIDALMNGKITLEQFYGTAHFIILAGFETTASTVSCLLWQLAKNPDVQSKMRKSIIEEGIDADYGFWCIMEALRWLTPVPLGTGRVLGEDVTTNDGLLIPKGTYVTPSSYSIHHDESIWPEHDKFKPERWRDQSKFHPAAFNGFGLGPRNCVGGKLAIHSIKLISKAILTKYKIEVCNETPENYDILSPGMIFTIPEKPVKLQFSTLD